MDAGICILPQRKVHLGFYIVPARAFFRGGIQKRSTAVKVFCEQGGLCPQQQLRRQINLKGPQQGTGDGDVQH